MTRTETERIEWGPEPGQVVGRIGTVRIIAHCPGNADYVLKRAREVMSIVAATDKDKWPSDGEWIQLLPKWFMAQCPPKPSEELIARMLALPSEERGRLEHRFWSVDSWVYWFQPDNRHWYWWDAAVIDENTIVIALEVTEWPFPWGDLKWLLLLAGATSVEAEQ